MRVRIIKEARTDNVNNWHVQRWDWYKPWWRYVDSASGADAEQKAIKCAQALKNPTVVEII